VCLATAWLALGGPIGVDTWLDVTEPPVPSAAIVVLAGGTNGRNLPLAQGWDRLVTANELFADRYAPVVVISGGGSSAVAEAEVYANAATWLGVSREAIVFETRAQGTKDHGAVLRGLALADGSVIGVDSPLLVVTSTFHARRALLSFHRAGFRRVRIVASYTARRDDAGVTAPPGSPAALTSTVADHRPSGKRYDDPLFRLAYRSFDLFIGLREIGAIVVE
jgi:uncharacterized SAM-binding protein YcdF (DUF218 family)